MAVLTEPKWPGEFGTGDEMRGLSRDTGVLISGQNLVAGTVLGQITTGGKYTIVAPGASDGSQVAAALLYAGVDASAGDKPCVVVKRIYGANQAELNFGTLNAGQIVTAIAQLAAVNIIVRPAV